MYSSDVKLCC